MSALSLGWWITYKAMPEQTAHAVIEAGVTAGVTFLDDARAPGLVFAATNSSYG